MPDYSQGKIYKLVHANAGDDFDDVYVGSTVMALSKRLQGHKGEAVGNVKAVDAHFQWMRDVGLENVVIVLIENYPCETKEQLRQRERYWQDALKPSLNTNRAYMTREDRLADKRKHFQENKDKIYEYRKQHRDEINNANRDRYQNDEEYRRKILDGQRQKRREQGVAPRVQYTEEERKAARKASSNKYASANPERRKQWKDAWEARMRENPEYLEKRRAAARERYAAKKARQTTEISPA